MKYLEHSNLAHSHTNGILVWWWSWWEVVWGGSTWLVSQEIVFTVFFLAFFLTVRRSKVPRRKQCISIYPEGLLVGSIQKKFCLLILLKL